MNAPETNNAGISANGSDLNNRINQDGVPKQMCAFVLSGHGDLDMLEYHTDWQTPVADANEVLIRVLACGLNNTDVNTRTAWYSKAVSQQTSGDALAEAESDDASWGGRAIELPRIQGADVVGTVVATSAQVDAQLIGKRVLVDTWLRDWSEPNNLECSGYFGSECDGGFAEYVKIDHHHVHPVNSDYSDVELATFATAYITAENMLSKACVGDGDCVLIPGASGGVGSALVQLAARRGAKTVALASESKHAGMKVLGADALLPRSPANLKQALKRSIGRDSVSVVADVVGGVDWPLFIDALERGGRYTCAGAIAGPMVNFDLRTFYLRDLSMFGATVPAPGLFADLVRYIEAREVRPILAEHFPLSELKQAQQTFIDKKHVGNIVVVP